MSDPLVVCLLGATASGKTALAMQLADYFPVHLISVDSAQIYRGMNIGSAKPDFATLSRYPHALIDILEVEESYSVAKFCAAAHEEIAKAHRANKIPILVGGTMLYFYSLFAGLSDLPTSNPQEREKIKQRIAQEGLAALHAELAAHDPLAAAQISAHDQQRLIRFLELIAVTGRTPSELFAAQTAVRPKWKTIAIGLNPERAILHTRIASRFHEMIQAGFIEEVETLRLRPHLSADCPAMRCVGYRQIWQFLAGNCGKEEAIELGIIATRQLAKRQITWLNNRLQTVLPLDILDPLHPATLPAVINKIEAALSSNLFLGN